VERVSTPVRLASWNLNGRAGRAAERLGDMFRDEGGADLVLLQEVSLGGLPRFCDAAALDWWVHVGAEFPDLLRARSRPLAHRVAIGGRGARLRGAMPFPDLPLPEKVLAGWIDIGGVPTTVVAYHAPVGVTHKLKKPAQAVRVAEWLRGLNGPTIIGGDFNTPKVDHPDFDATRTHWHSGDAKLKGNPGDDLLIGWEPTHNLRDALRTYLGAHPEELAAISAARPEGPLHVSYCTDKHGKNRFRYDAIWLSPHFEVSSVVYRYEEALAAGTDHALVVVDAALNAKGDAH
jgi:hypothetical protein